MKAHCNTCGGMRNHERLNKVVKRWNETIHDGYQISGADTYFLLECKGCESVKLLHQSWFSEHTDPDGEPIINSVYYPPSTFRARPRWLNDLDMSFSISALVGEIYQAMQNDAPSLAAMGIRAVIEQIMVEKIKDNGSFGRNLAAFKDAGYISEVQQRTLEAALEIGHATIHRAYRPEPSQLELALDIMENLVHVIYVLDSKVEDAVRRVPPRGRASDGPESA